MKAFLFTFCALLIPAGLFPAVCPALVPPLPPIKAVELKPIAAVELTPFKGKPVAAVELRPVAAAEAPYEYQTAQLTPVVSTAQSITPIITADSTAVPSHAIAVYVPIVHPPGATAADYNPQMY